MVGETVSHYRIVELLGAGGMGVVYKAEDTRLKRLVALKFLPIELTRDVEAKERLMQEAQSASALDHPNICTIHEIDETADGRLFVAMAYYDGETLKQRLARGRLTIQEAVDTAAQVAKAVAAAHDAHIVHRDIKSANIIVTRRGDVKLLDFGLAKLAGQTALTRTGTTVGTVAYMSPEQIAGVGADQRSDVWAVGVVLYEMLTGSLPFGGDNDAAVLNGILNKAPRPPREERPEISEDLERVVLRALEKEPTARFASAHELLQQLPVSASSTKTVTVGPSDAPAVRRATWSRLAIPAAVVVLVAGLAGWVVNSRRNAGSARETTLRDIRQLVASDNYVAAFALAKRTEPALKNDPEFSALWPQVSLMRSFASEPAGASVYVRDVALRSAWQLIGQTPLTDVRLPVGSVRWKIEKPGFETSEFIWGISPIGPPLSLDLLPSGSVPRNMVRIPPGNLNLILTGYDYNRNVPAGAFLIDRFEVTNRDFKEFVDAGGYTNQQYWKHELRKDGRAIAWENAVTQFRDQTGRPGPSTWEVGTFPKGLDDHPVGGISWYEAAAYAEFRGRSLPTVYHWLRAAGTWLAAQITPFSNFGRSGPMAVGASTAISPGGLFDAAGNLKEWCWNEMEAGATRYILGGAWNDPDYMFIYPDARPPFDRSATNGFRTVKYLTPDSLPAETMVRLERPTRNYDKEKPASDEVFRAYKSTYAYDAAPLDAAVEKVDDSAEHWRKEKVSFKAAYGNERVPAYVFLPKHARPPYQAVLYWPGSGAVRSRSSDVLPDMAPLEFLLLSGRAVVYPVYYGTYERSVGRDSTWPDTTRAYRDWVVRQVNDARRTLDYLETRQDIRRDALGYYGTSWGARMSSLVLAQDARPRAAVLASGGFSPGTAPPEMDPLNFAPRVTIPVLMVNGDHDFIFEVELSQKPMFRFLGSKPDQKKHLVLEAGHGVMFDKRSQVIREALDWFDRYLGPAQ